MSRKVGIRSEPLTHVGKLWGSGAMVKDTYLYPVIILQRPTTVTFYNVSVSTDSWTKIPASATLSAVLSWRLSERSGNDFHYAYVSAPTTYATAFGIIQRDTEISAVYVKRPTGAGTLTIELEVWT